jgi:hypothetical protein
MIRASRVRGIYIEELSLCRSKVDPALLHPKPRPDTVKHSTQLVLQLTERRTLGDRMTRCRTPRSGARPRAASIAGPASCASRSGGGWGLRGQPCSQALGVRLAGGGGRITVFSRVTVRVDEWGGGPLGVAGKKSPSDRRIHRAVP